MSARRPTLQRPDVHARANVVEITIRMRTLIVIALAAGAAAAVVAIRGALVIVFTGIFLALVFEMPVRACTRRLHVRRNIAAAIVVLGTVVILTVLALVLLAPLVNSLIDFLKALPQLVQDLRASDELSWLGDSGAAENVQSGATSLGGTIPTAVNAFLGVAGSAFATGLTLFTIIFITLFLLMDIPPLQGALGSVLVPTQRARVLMMWERITVTVSRWAIGAGAIAIIAGCVQGGGAWLLGSSYAVALGVIAGLLDLIPTIGATIAGFILVPTLLAEKGLTAALVMLGIVLVYQQLENNILTPTIQGKAVDISGFFVIVSVTVFGALLGVLGALVAVPVTASLQIVVRELTAERRARMRELAAPGEDTAEGAGEPDAAPDPGEAGAPVTA